MKCLRGLGNLARDASEVGEEATNPVDAEPYPAPHFDRVQVAAALGLPESELFAPPQTHYLLQRYNENSARIFQVSTKDYQQYIGTLLQAADPRTYQRIVAGDLTPQYKDLLAAIREKRTSQPVLLDPKRNLYLRFKVEDSNFSSLFIEKGDQEPVTRKDLSHFGQRLSFRPEYGKIEFRDLLKLDVPTDIAVIDAAPAKYSRDFGKLTYDTKDVIPDGPQWDVFTTILARLGITPREFDDLIYVHGPYRGSKLILDEVKKTGINPQTRARIQEMTGHRMVQGRTQTPLLDFKGQPEVEVYRRASFTPDQLVQLVRTGSDRSPANLILSGAAHQSWVGPGYDLTFTIDKFTGLSKLRFQMDNVPLVQHQPQVPVLVKAVVPSSHLSKTSEYARWSYVEYGYDVSDLEGNQLSSVYVLDRQGKIKEYSLKDLGKMTDDQIRALVH